MQASVNCAEHQTSDFFKNPPKGVKSFKILDAPSAECNKRLYDEFESQARGLPWAQDWRREETGTPMDDIMIVSTNKEPLTASEDIATPGRITLMHFDSVRVRHAFYPSPVQR